MKKTEILENEINLAIEKISLLKETDKIEVYNIFNDLYKNHTIIPSEEFINDFYYQTYQKSILMSRPRIEEELKSLINNDDDTNTSENFFQIRASLLLMSGKGFTR